MTIQVCPECDIAGCRHIRAREAAKPAPEASEHIGLQYAETRFLNLVLDIRRVIGWEKPLNDFDVVNELQEYIASLATTPQPAPEASDDTTPLTDKHLKDSEDWVVRETHGAGMHVAAVRAIERHYRARGATPVVQGEPVHPNDQPYCIACEKAGHRTDECWSTHGYNSPRDKEIFRLAHGATPVVQGEPAWMTAFDNARDMILNDHGPLEGEGMTNDQTNAVLTILDDCFMPHLKRIATHAPSPKGPP